MLSALIVKITLPFSFCPRCSFLKITHNYISYTRKILFQLVWKTFYRAFTIILYYYTILFGAAKKKKKKTKGLFQSHGSIRPRVTVDYVRCNYTYTSACSKYGSNFQSKGGVFFYHSIRRGRWKKCRVIRSRYSFFYLILITMFYLL